MLLKPDPTFYASAKDAMQAPPETLAYVALLSASGDGAPDALAVVDADATSATYATERGRVTLPNAGDELHHFGWNACSAALCPFAPHPHVERRYLIVPGLRSSRIHIVDTKPDASQPRIVRVIEPQELIERTGYTRPHTVHCGPDAVYVSALGNANGDGPGGIFMMDCDTFDVIGPWEVDRGPQYFAYDFWWHLTHDVMVTSEWGTPNMIEGGVDPSLLLEGKYGHQLHFWNLRSRRHVQAVDLGAEQQFVLELRPSHNPENTYGFVGVVISLKDLSSSIWLWYRDKEQWAIKKVIEIPAEPADPENLPDLLKGFSAVPPLLSDIDLSL
ncbi:MAG: selenium-binding protein, partial [Candidatus Eremiobacteraeota bacterium]|nr:selenium-binding protein [Candidatus Eremiobacteraeota bacterium]